MGKDTRNAGLRLNKPFVRLTMGKTGRVRALSATPPWLGTSPLSAPPAVLLSRC